MPEHPDLELFAVTAPGLEALCAGELGRLGIPARAGPGGAGWRGDLRSLYRANLESRTASRLLARLGEFRARTFFELERHAARQPWVSYLRPGDSVLLRVTARKSKLYHEGAIAERFTRVLQDSFGVAAVTASRADDEGDAPPTEDTQLIVIRFMRDVCTISVDASGALLHQRGYRQAVAKAPMRETIAAAVLLASAWQTDTPLLDPMCGSGTIPIEAALLARGIAPGLANPQHEPRAYACLRWPSFDAHTWTDVVATARSAIRPGAAAPIHGSDSSAGAITASLANAARAGVVGDVTFERRPLSAVEPASASGCLVTNAPYGVRVGERRDLYPLYEALGRLARERLQGWTIALLTADAGLAAATGLPLREALATRNGGINVRLLTAHVAG